MDESTWPREYLGRLATATLLNTVGVVVAVWIMLALAGGNGWAYLIAPFFALAGTFLVGSYVVLTGPDDTPPWPFALILGGFFGVVIWAGITFVLATR